MSSRTIRPTEDEDHFQDEISTFHKAVKNGTFENYRICLIVENMSRNIGREVNEKELFDGNPFMSSDTIPMSRD